MQKKNRVFSDVQPRRLAIIGAPVDLGQDKSGVGRGPTAVRFADVGTSLTKSLSELGHTVEEDFDIEVDHRSQLEPPAEEDVKKGKYLPNIVAASAKLADVVERAAILGKFPSVIGGDHSVAIGSVAGISAYYRKRNQKIGLIWVDAHADMNTPETSRSHNVHGMPLACCIGKGPPELTGLGGFRVKVDPANVVLIGLRSVDVFPRQSDDEKRHVMRSGIHVYTMREIDEMGILKVARKAISLALKGTVGFHVSFDMDFVDPLEAPGVGTPVPGGSTLREAHLIMEMLCDSRRMTSLEVVEVNPDLDDGNRTAKLAKDLIETAMGKRRI